MTISHWPCIAAMLLFSLIASGGFCEEKQEYFETFFPKSEDPESNQLKMDAEWRIWIPAEVETLRGVVVHQHGCGAGSSEGGRTEIYDRLCNYGRLCARVDLLSRWITHSMHRVSCD